MQRIVQFNGKFGCSWCLHPGVSIPSFKKKKKTIKYPLLDKISELRDPKKSLSHATQAVMSEKGEPVYGMKHPSPLVHLKKYNSIRGSVPDGMHLIFLGICRQFDYYWFSMSGYPFSLGKNTLEHVEEKLGNIKAPRQIARAIRTMKDRKHWKSREWENWLLYFSLPILKSIPGFERYTNYWELLVKATHIVLGDSIISEDIMEAHKKLKTFVGLTEELYGAAAMTYNIHQLLHLCQSIFDWGPMWSHFGYPFESGNGQIVKTIKAANGVVSQVCRSIEYQKSAEKLESHLKITKNSPTIQFCSSMSQKFTAKSIKLTNIRYFGNLLDTTDKHKLDFQLSENAKSCHRIVKDNCLFTSSEKKLERSDSSYAVLDNNDFIQIKEFIIDETSGNELTIYKKLNTQNKFDNCSKVQLVNNTNEELAWVETKKIKNLAVYVDTGLEAFIVAVPNKYHY